MSDILLSRRPKGVVPLVPVTPAGLTELRSSAPAPLEGWITASRFRADPGQICLVANEAGNLAQVLVGVRGDADPWALGDLALGLPEGDYVLECDWSASQREAAGLGFALGAYRYTRYRPRDREPARLVLGEKADLGQVRRLAEAVNLVRDLINTPADALMPEQLGEAAGTLARRFGGELHEVVGDDLLAEGYPAIHAVGRASTHPPRLIDLRWGDPGHPRVTLVGKGVCFDSGGLDIKSASGMRLMKKDMGGAAHALGLGQLVMGSNLPVRLRVLVPAVENAIAGNAFRPGDVLATRKGLSVEIDNTDAEGRLVLADALHEGATESPSVLVDFATLTGAARVALGPDLPALFASHDEVADEVLAAAAGVRDPLWRMPLHDPYREMIESKIADLVNSGASPYAGAITAALFLRAFVPAEVPWLHLDLMAWNLRARPGRPEGGEAMGLRALFAWIEGRHRPD